MVTMGLTMAPVLPAVFHHGADHAGWWPPISMHVAQAAPGEHHGGNRDGQRDDRHGGVRRSRGDEHEPGSKAVGGCAQAGAADAQAESLAQSVGDHSAE